MAIRKLNGRWQVRVYQGRTPDGRRHDRSQLVDSEHAAKILQGQWLAERDQGRQVGPDATLDQLLDRYLSVARMEASTRYQATRTLARYVRPALGPVKVAKVRGWHLDNLYAQLEQGSDKQRKLSPTTVKHVHTYLHAALGLAVRWEWIARNPADSASPPAEARYEPAPPSADVLGALLDYLCAEDATLALFVRLAALTGLRRGALCALRRSDLDLDSCTLRSRRALGVGQGSPYEKATKTGIQHPIALDHETCDLLRLHLKGQDETAAYYNCTVPDDGFVFSTAEDARTPWHPQRASREFAKARLKVEGAEAVKLRELRHWMATVGLEHASPRTVAGRSGHSRTSTLTDRYAAWVPASDRNLADALAQALATVREIGA